MNSAPPPVANKLSDGGFGGNRSEAGGIYGCVGWILGLTGPLRSLLQIRLAVLVDAAGLLQRTISWHVGQLEPEQCARLPG